LSYERQQISFRIPLNRAQVLIKTLILFSG